MKPRRFFRVAFPLASAVAALLAAPAAHAVSYYWDTNGSTAGLGNTAGTWGSSVFLSNTPTPNYQSAGIILDGTATPVASVTTSADSIYFGTGNLALGTTASTIGITANGVTINTIVFGAGQGAQGVTLSGGGGTITLAGTGPTATPTITSNNTGINTIAAILAGSGGMTAAGSGTLTLTNASNSLTGTVTVAGGGRLNLGNGISGGFTSTTNALTFNAGGGTFNLAKADTGSQTMGALSFSAGDGSVISTAASGSATQTLTFGSFSARTAGATGNFSLATNTTAASNRITLTNSTNAPVNGSGSNNQGLFFGGTEYTRYDTTLGYFRAVNYGADFNAAGVVGTGATLGINNAATDVKISGDITGQTTASVNTLNLAANNFTFDNAASTLSVNGILSAGSASASIANGTNASSIQTTASGGELVIRVNGASDALTIAPNIVANGASSLTKSGAGTLTLSGTNTYTGTTTVNAGTLALSGGAAIVNTGAVVMANAPGATLLLNASETIGQVSGGGFSGGNVNVGANTLTIANANNQTFGGTFSGTSGGGLTISSGILTLSNRNSFAGTITLAGTSQLTLTYGYDGAANPVPLSSGGTISMAGGTFLNLNPIPNVAGGVAGYLTSNTNGGYSITNPIVLSSAGTATIQTAAITNYNDLKWNFSGGVTGGAGLTQTLAINPGGFSTGQGDRQDILFSGVIANGSGGALGVSVDFKAGSGTGQEVNVNLSAQNTFTGPISLVNTRGLVFAYNGNSSTGGYLGIGGEINHVGFSNRTATIGGGSLAGGNYTNTISLATGTALSYLSTQNQTLGGAISGGGAVIIEGAGAGTLTLSNANSYTGGTFVSSGTLLLSGANNLPTTGTLAVSSGGNFSLADGTVRNTTANTLTLASGSLLSFDWSSAGTVDNLAPTAAITPAASAAVGIIINPIGTPTGGGNLLTGVASSTLNNPNYFLANNTNFTATITKPAAGAGSVSIGSYAAVGALTDAYWKRNVVTNATDTMAFSLGTLSNWATNATGTSAGGVVPGGSGVNVIFGSNTAGSSAVTVGANMNLGSLTFNDTVSYNISGNNTITLNSTSGTAASTLGALQTVTAGSAISVTSFANASNTISANVALGASQTWNVASGKTLNVSGTVSGAGFDLTKADAGTVILSGVATYSGVTTVSAGTLQFTNQYSLYGNNPANWTAANIKANSDATLAFNVGGLNAGAPSQQFSMANVTTLLANLGGLGGSINNNGLQSGSFIGFDTTNAVGNTFTVADNIADSTGTGGGAIGVTKLGTNTLLLTGTNTYTGATRIAAGTLRVSNGAALGSASNTLDFRGGTLQAGGAFTSASTRGVTMTGAGTIDTNGNAVTIAGAFSGTGGLTKSGLGTLTLSNAIGHTGGTTVSAGTLLVSGANYLPSTGTLAVSNGGTFSLADGTARTTTGATSGTGLTLASGSNLAFDWDGASIDSLTLSGTATASSTGNVGIIINGTNTPSGSGTLISTVAASTLNTANYFLVNNTNFTATITKAANSVSIGSYATTSALTDAYWKGGLANAVGSMTLSSGTASNWVSTIGGTTTGVVPGGSSVNVIFGATGASNQTAVTTGADMNLGSITFNDSAAVTIAGSPNTITLNSTSSAAATTTGALQTVTAGSAISVTSFASATNSISANLALGANQTWNVASGKTLNVSGIVSGAFNLNKADAGTVTLSGANTYTGTTTISAGTLQIGAGGTTGNLSTTGILVNNGNLTINRSNAVSQGADLPSLISGTGSVTWSGSNTLTLNGANSYSGGTTLTAGTVAISNATSFGTGNVTVSGTSRINVTGGITYANNIAVNGALTMQNPGTATSTATFSGVLSGSNSITLPNTGGGSGIQGIIAFTNPGNTFTGNVLLSTTGGGDEFFSFNSLGDGGNFTFQKNGNRQGVIYAGSPNIVFNTRTINIGSTLAGIADGGGTNPVNSFQNNGTGAITFNANMSVASTITGGTFFFSGSNTGENTYAGNIPKPATSGVLSIGKFSTGKWILSGANTYNGKTDIRGGTLSINSIQNASSTTGNSLGTPGVGANSIIDLAGGTTLQYTGIGHGSDRVINLTTAGGGTFTLDASGTGTFALTGGVTSAGTSGTSTLTLAGTGLGSQSGLIANGTSTNVTAVTKSGSGTWTLSNTNTYTGGTNVNGGTLLLSGAFNLPTTGTLAVGAGGTFSLADGTVRNTTATGLTLTSGAILGFDWAGATNTADNLAPTAAITPTAGAAVGIMINPTGTPTTTVNLLTTAAGTSTLQNPNYFLANNTNFTATITKPVATGAGSVTIGNYAAVTALTDAYWKGGLTNAVGTMAFSSGSASNWVATIGGTTTGVVPGGNAVNAIFGATGASNQSAVTTGANMNLGSITFNDSAAVTLAGSHTITLNSTGTTAAASSGSLTAITNTGVVGGISAISVTSSANATNTISANLALGASQTWNVANGKTLNVSGIVSGTGFALTKADAGIVTLSNANTYSGGTTISGGTIQANNSSALGTGSVSVATGAKLHVNANSVTINNNITLNGTTTNGAIYSGDRPTGNVTNLIGQITLSATSNMSSWWNDKTLQLSGKITGAGGLDFVLQPSSTGGRYYITGGTNDYAGATSVTGSAVPLFTVFTGQAMLYLGATNALPTTTALTLNNADLYLNGQSQTLPSISGTGSFSVRNGSTTAATLILGSGNTTSSFSGSIKDNGLSVTYTAADTATTPTLTTGTVALTKIGSGTLTLTEANTYSGATAVNQGTLLVNNTTGSGTGTNTVSVGPGATLGGTGTIAGAVNVTGVLSPGASIETLGTGALSFANGSTLVHELDSSVGAAAGSDLLKVTGNLSLVGTVGLSLSDLAITDVAFNVDDVFSLINYTGSLTGGGLFSVGGNDLAEAEEFTFGLNTWRINYTAAEGGLNYTGEYAGTTDSFVNITVIPEPSSVALLATLGGMLLLRRRR